MRFKTTIPFFTAETASGAEHEYQNSKSDSITLQVYGTFTSASVKVEAKSEINAPYTPIAVIDLADYSVCDNGAIVKAGRYAVGADGVMFLRVKLLSVSGGDITVVGLATNTAEV